MVRNGTAVSAERRTSFDVGISSFQDFSVSNRSWRIIRRGREAVAIFVTVFLFVAGFQTKALGVWINEIHYDNTGSDTGEFVEVAGVAGTDLSEYAIALYNGNGGGSYDGLTLSGIIPDQENGYGTIAFSWSGIQNGAPDGLALYSTTLGLIQFLSYEGSFVGSGGVADGVASVDIGVGEDPAPAAGSSLQLIGTGNSYADFSWSGPIASTGGSVNLDQSFGVGVPEGGATFFFLAIGILSQPLFTVVMRR